MYMKLFKNLPTARSAIMLQALKTTNDEHITLQMPQLKELLNFALKNDLKKLRAVLSTTTLDKWVQSSQEQKCQSEFDDSDHFHQAY